LLLLATKNFGEDQSSSFGGEHSNQNCVASSRRGWVYFVEYLGFTGLIFAIFSPYERALCADDGSIHIFQFAKGRYLATK